MHKNFRLTFFIISFLGIFVFSGAKPTIGKIDFEGNTFITNDRLSYQINSKKGNIFNQKVLNNDIKLISRLYEQKGFYNIKIHTPVIIPKLPDEVDIKFRIDEKDNPAIAKLQLIGNHYISDRMIFDKISNNAKELPDIQMILKNIVDFYASNGFFFADIQINNIKIISDSLDVTLQIKEGKHCDFKEYKFEGNKVTRRNTLLKISRLSLVKDITRNVLQQAAENVRRKDYIKSCQIIPINHSQLLFKIEEDRMSRISGIAGLDNSKEKQGITGFMNLQFLNLYGTDRSLSLNWQHLSTTKRIIELSYHESGFRDIPINGNFILRREEIDSTYIKTKFDSEMYYYDLLNKFGFYFGQDDIFPQTNDQQLAEKLNFRKLGIFWQRINIDNFLNPTRGSEFYLKYYYIFSNVEGNNVKKQSVEFSWEKYYDLAKKIVSYSNISANVIENKDLSEFETYELGGNKNLRGFNENNFSGFRIGWINLELRYLLGNNSRIFLFSDYGYVESTEYTFGKLFGFGFGLRTETKLGILGIDYGLNYNGKNFRNPLDGIIHFGLETKL